MLTGLWYNDLLLCRDGGNEQAQYLSHFDEAYALRRAKTRGTEGQRNEKIVPPFTFCAICGSGTLSEKARDEKKRISPDNRKRGKIDLRDEKVSSTFFEHINKQVNKESVDKERMENRIYTPVAYIPETVCEMPVIFLAGPIQGAGDWQAEAAKIIHARRPEVIIASPRGSHVPGAGDHGKHIDWGTHHLRRAAQNGAILFWLPCEKAHVPSHVYAQTSRFELAEWKVRHERDGARIVIGIEQGFSGERYIRRRFAQDCPNVPILETLFDACKQVIEVIFSR